MNNIIHVPRDVLETLVESLVDCLYLEDGSIDIDVLYAHGLLKQLLEVKE